MAVLVTGGAGYIGSHMVWRLLDAHEDVVVLDNLTTGFRWAVAPEARLVVGDIADAALLDRIFPEYGIDAVIHFAGVVVVPESVVDPLKYYRENTSKSQALIASAVRHGVKAFIFSSTAAVYGEPERFPVGEDDRKLPTSPYGMSKLMVERILADTSAAHGLPYAALRYFNVAGADPAGRTGQSTAGATHLIKVACETGLGKRDRLTIFGTDYDTHDGTGVRDYIHVSDLAEAHALALQYLRDGGTSFVANAGYGSGFSVLDVVKAIEANLGLKLPVTYEARRPGDVGAVVARNERIRSLLPWQPRYQDIDKIVATTLAWERSLASRNDLRG
ncbi:MAG: UDP-glucose 4-epimerase GalE [Hyphomicrobiaceae bacterium]|nr:UDP-glucose 4-epimerase GalE [Hyphomicrobiaceae bacterium]